MPVPASSQLPPFLSSTLLRSDGAASAADPPLDLMSEAQTPLAVSEDTGAPSPPSNHSTPRVAVQPLPPEGQDNKNPSQSQRQQQQQQQQRHHQHSFRTVPLTKTTLSSTTPIPLLLVPPLNFDMICGGSRATQYSSRGPAPPSSTSSATGPSSHMTSKGPSTSSTLLSSSSTGIASSPNAISAQNGTIPSTNTSSSSSSSSSSNSSSALYRSGHPNERNEPFLSTLGLRTILYLATDDVRPNLSHFASEMGIRLVHVQLNVNKEPFAEMDTDAVLQALETILDKRNLPCLVHCNKGKYRVGVITGLIRRLQGWSLTSIYDEYARFAGTDRIADEEFIDMFPLHRVKRPDPLHAPDWL